MVKNKKKAEEIEVIESTSLIQIVKNAFKIEKTENKKYSVSKGFFILIGILCIALFSGGYLLGINFDIRNAFIETEEQVQEKIEKNLENEIASLNEAVKEAGLDKKVTFVTDGTISGHNYYQYVSYTSSEDGYVAWIVDKDSKEVLSVWVAEQKKEDEDGIAPTLLEAVMNLYKDKIPSDKTDTIKEISKTTNATQIADDDFLYIQQFSTEDLNDGYEYIGLYELDFFTYEIDLDTEVTNEEGEVDEE